jgi:short-subunit dehydrogenase
MPAALVTGASSGIGAAFSRQLARAGYDLILVARDESRLDLLAGQLHDEHGAVVQVLAADLATDDGIAAVSDQARGVDLLVNNAGFGNPAPFGAASLDDELRMLKVHCEAVLRLTSAALAGMAAAGATPAASPAASTVRRGVINVASVSAFTGRGSYGASKAWMVSFTLGVAADLATQHRPEHVMALCPGLTRTEFHQRAGMGVAGVPNFMWLDADRVAADAMRDFRNGGTVCVPGLQYKAIVALARIAPPTLAARLGSRTGRRYK